MNGLEVWELVKTYQSQMRVAGMGSVLGVDYTPLIALFGDLGVDRRSALFLLPYVEAGLVAGFKARQEAEKDANGRT